MPAIKVRYPVAVYEHEPTCAGDRYFPVFEREGDDLVKTEKRIDLQAKINSFKDDVLLKRIIERCALTGETLAASAECFGDTTVLPKDLLEAQQKAAEVHAFTSALSPEDYQLLISKGFDEFMAIKLAQKQASSSSASAKLAQKQASSSSASAQTLDKSEVKKDE